MSAVQLELAPVSPWSTDDVPPPRARISDPPASHEAAVRALPNAKAQEKWIVGALRMAGSRGATAREIATALGEPWSNVIVSRRIAGLREAGYLVTYDLSPGEVKAGHRSPEVRRDGCHVHVACIDGAPVGEPPEVRE